LSVRGFLLQSTYRIRNGRAVVHLYGRLETGEPFLVTDDRQKPHFFVAADDAERALLFGAENVSPTRLTTFDGRPVSRVDVRLPADTRPLRRRFHEQGIVCFEADVLFARRYLIDRGIRGALEIDGEGRPGEGRPGEGRPGEGPLRVFHNPEIGPSTWKPDLAVLSFDIETDPRAERLLSIALHGRGAAGAEVSEVLLFCPRDLPAPAGAVPFSKERDLLAGFCRRVREIDPDVLTGWNAIDFDLRVLDKMARAWNVRLDLGRGPGALRLRESRFPWASLEAEVSGRVTVDGIHLLRGSFVRMEQYSLDAVAREVLGEGKLITGHDRAREIVASFLHDRDKLVAYNLTDARLVLEILDRLGLIELSVQRSLLTGLPIDRVAGSIAAFDFLYLSELGRRGVVAPSVEDAAEPASETAANLGGHVLDPQPGLYENVLVFDFKSLYPSVIRTFQIDPLGYLPERRDEDDAVVAPNGAAFRRGDNILPGLVDELFPRREAAKAAGNKIASHAIKILMNSFYGVLGTTACRFYRPEIASAVTSFGRAILIWSEERFKSYGYSVIYGDTDSLFVVSGEDDAASALARGERLAADLNRDLAGHVLATWQVESRLELQLERLYRRLLLPPMRHGRGGARKRYAGLVEEDGRSEVVFTGMEVVRRDWTELAKQVQRELYERLFHDRELGDYLRGVVADLRAGRLDDLLVYKKGLRKSLEEYTATTPPHVAAARKMTGRARRLIAYVVTSAGAEPAGERASAIDYEHYVQKQVRPVAEPVLGILGLDFDKVIGDDAQLELF
jgi:DNA polymerase-2